MAFEGLSERLENSFKKLRAKGKLTESDVKEAMREVRLALLEADVNYKVSKEFTAKVTERAIGADVMESLTPSQMVIKIVNEELTELMGGNEARLAIANHPPTIVMMCGLQGSGKTTHSAKLALKLKKEGHRPLLVACDVYRPAAIKQLQVVGEQVGVPVFWVWAMFFHLLKKQSKVLTRKRRLNLKRSLPRINLTLTICLINLSRLKEWEVLKIQLR